MADDVKNVRSCPTALSRSRIVLFRSSGYLLFCQVSNEHLAALIGSYFTEQQLNMQPPFKVNRLERNIVTTCYWPDFATRNFFNRWCRTYQSGKFSVTELKVLEICNKHLIARLCCNQCKETNRCNSLIALSYYEYYVDVWTHTYDANSLGISTQQCFSSI